MQIDLNPGPSGSRGPATRGRSAKVPESEAPQDGFGCEFPGCGRSFETATGRGLHHRRAHPDWYDQRQNIVHVKARWNDEETRLLAREEATLTRRNVKFLNQALLEIFPGRTLESIKGKRKQAAYKQLVQEFLAEDQPAEMDEGSEPELVAQDVVDYKAAIASYVQSLPVPQDEGFKLPRLLRLCSSLCKRTQAQVADELALYLREVFPVKQQCSAKGQIVKPKDASKKQARKAEYARTQDLWRKNRSKCIRIILDDITGVKAPPKEVMVPCWKAIMTAKEDSAPGGMAKKPVIKELWSPITCDEVKAAKPPSTTAAGPDGVSARLIRKMPNEVLCRILNIIMWCGQAPQQLLQSITILIPKKSGATEPGDFRPLTISSVIIRTLHKVLAKRMAKSITLDQRQRAFRKTDGCSDNIFLLDLILRHHHAKHKPLFMASLDLAKAFDSVTHKTIQETLCLMGLPLPMVEYIMNTYMRSCTRLGCDGWKSDSINPKCGVKQGDPMSPIIFNMIIDRLLRQLPEDIGAKIGDLTVNAAAFADDMLLFASTPMGLQSLLDRAVGFLSLCGLKVNASKCLTVSIRNVPHEKKTIIDKDTVFLCQQRELPALKRTDDWRYLGVPFTPEGKSQVKVTAKLLDAVTKLTRAALKPQQRLYALRTMVLPGIYHQLELGCTSISILKKCDKIVRHTVRRWLNLPSDSPNAYIHACVKDGGLGIEAARWSAPLRRLNRLKSLPLAQQNREGPPGAFLSKEMDTCNKRLLPGMISAKDVAAKWAELLYARVDGKGLEESNKVPRQHNWVMEGTRFLSGRDFLQSCKLRINALPTKSRTTRGRPIDRMCRAGCRWPETLDHVIQKCHRTHGPRIKRHNAIVSYIAQGLRKQEYMVEVEPVIETAGGRRKPDVVAKLGQTALVIDAQVVNDQIDLDQAHRRKSDTYKNIDAELKKKYAVNSIEYTSATLSWRGVWSKASAEGLLNLGVIRKGAVKVISSRVLIGGLTAFHQFNRTTTVAR